MSSSNNNNNNQGNEGYKSIPNSAITSAWGGMNNFMASYGIKPTPDGYAEANAMIQEFKKADYESGEYNNSKSSSHSTKK